MTKEELKQGYQPKSCNLKNIVPPSVSTNVKPKKDGYTWEDLDKAWWEGFDNAKNKMEKRIAELEAEVKEWKDKADLWCKTANLKDHNIMINKELEKENAELKEALKNDKVCKCSHYLNFKDLEKENAELKEQNRKLLESCEGATMMYEHLTKAKEFLKRFLGLGNLWDLDCKDYFPLRKEAEQFLNDLEK